MPPPFEGSKYSFTTGPKAVREGWTIFGVGVLVSVLMIALTLALRAGYLALEDWVTLVVGFWVIMGVVSGIQAIFRRILRSK